jgi:hypothetical protein
VWSFAQSSLAPLSLRDGTGPPARKLACSPLLLLAL